MGSGIRRNRSQSETWGRKRIIWKSFNSRVVEKRFWQTEHPLVFGAMAAQTLPSSLESRKRQKRKGNEWFEGKLFLFGKCGELLINLLKQQLELISFRDGVSQG